MINETTMGQTPEKHRSS